MVREIKRRDPESPPGATGHAHTPSPSHHPGIKVSLAVLHLQPFPGTQSTGALQLALPPPGLQDRATHLNQARYTSSSGPKLSGRYYLGQPLIHIREN